MLPLNGEGGSAMVPQPAQQSEYYEAKAVEADGKAASASTNGLAESWEHVAETYRWMAYHRRAIGKWGPLRPLGK